MAQRFSFRLSQELLLCLEDLSQRTGRSKSCLAAEAVTRYVATEHWQVEQILAGIEDIEQGRTIDHAEVTRWLKSCGTPGEYQLFTPSE
jgi:RHH-type transcriptional regulator, rel operon repressor / antitoxin RelB